MKPLIEDIVNTVESDNPSLILLDVGGVLMPDTWETLVLTPVHGVAAKLEYDEEALQTLYTSIPHLWNWISTNSVTEKQWWNALVELVGKEITTELVAEIEDELLHPFPWAQTLLEELSQRSALGIITDNTDFWYEKQYHKLNLSKYITEAQYVSSHVHLRKKDGLFQRAASENDASSTLVIDDREHNIIIAQQCNFNTYLFTLPSHTASWVSSL